MGRSLACCEIAVLLIDATQGIQAQTFSNFWAAFSRNLHIIPVVNKIDLPHANSLLVKEQLQSQFEISPNSVIEISAKTGAGVSRLLEEICHVAPSPNGHLDTHLQCLLFDCWHDNYRGIICMIRLIQGKVIVGKCIKSLSSGNSYTVQDVGILTPKMQKVQALYAGQVGYVIAGIKSTREITIGDTFIDTDSNQKLEPEQQIFPSKPQVYAGFFPLNLSEYSHLKQSIERLAINDSSTHISEEVSESLGAGFRIGFLGALHLDVFRQRLEQEFNAEIIITTPSVPYKGNLFC